MQANFRTGLFVASLAFAAAMSLQLVPASAQGVEALKGNWRSPPYTQQRYRMSEQCQALADTEKQAVGESRLELFDCNDPKYADVKARIERYVRNVNPVYRQQGHPLYTDKIQGMCAVVRESASERTVDASNPAPDLRKDPIVGLPVIWNIRPTGRRDWPYRGDSYSPSSGYGAISCFKDPSQGELITKGCRRWKVEMPFVGGGPCDCGCTVVCESYVWQRK